MSSTGGADGYPEPQASASGQFPEHGRWRILLVDDEPAVHEITRLLLANVEYLGIPIDLHSVYSAAQARSFLQQHPDTALMLLDVVMETDDAGLALVRYVREQLHNSDLQIVLRTGQPGMAPEREVVLRYEINGYFLKTEITAQKLHSIVISSLRTYKGLKALRPHGQPGSTRQTDSVPEHPPRSLDDELDRNIRRGAAHLVAQPQLHLASNAIVGMELISNWKARDGVMSPAQLAEAVHDFDLRLKADEWLLRQGCAWARSWQALGLTSFRVSLPLVTEQVWNSAFLSLVERCLEEFEPPPGTLDLEVPEHALLDARSQARDALAFVQAKGVSVTLLDFGSEMISLPWLQRLLPDRVRIHRTFVRNVTQDNEKAAIARTLIALAHTIGMTVIADGIATELDLQFFKWEGCDVAQGDFIARSLAVQDVSEFLRSSKTMTH